MIFKATNLEVSLDVAQERDIDNSSNEQKERAQRGYGYGEQHLSKEDLSNTELFKQIENLTVITME